MSNSISAVALFLVASLCSIGTAQAEDLKFSELEARLSNIESQLAAGDSIQQASYCDGCGCNDCCCDSCGCCDCCGCGDCCSSCGCGGGYYAEVDVMFLRTHVGESSGFGGKTSEQYDLSTRWILGYENCCGQGARIRYWHYGHRTDRLPPDADNPFRFEMNVIDAELTHRIQMRRTDVTLAGGVRFGNTEILDTPDDGSGNDDVADIDFIGLTMAADVETILCCNCCRYWSAIYGGRVSMLAGDWEEQTNLNRWVAADRDDNIVVTELYAGVEYGCCHCGRDIYLQLKFEVQNWHSDAILAEDNANGTISFVGPSFLVGIGF